jgi:hypothetical protein
MMLNGAPLVQNPRHSFKAPAEFGERRIVGDDPRRIAPNDCPNPAALFAFRGHQPDVLFDDEVPRLALLKGSEWWRFLDGVSDRENIAVIEDVSGRQHHDGHAAGLVGRRGMLDVENLVAVAQGET